MSDSFKDLILNLSVNGLNETIYPNTIEGTYAYSMGNPRNETAQNTITTVVTGKRNTLMIAQQTIPQMNSGNDNMATRAITTNFIIWIIFFTAMS